MAGQETDEEAAMRARIARLVRPATERRTPDLHNDPIVSGPGASLTGWMIAAVIGLVLLAGWTLYRAGRPDPAAPRTVAEDRGPALGEPLAPTGALPQDARITRPDWLRKPSGDDLALHYPSFATLFGKDGRTTIRCRVTAAGSLTDCLVVAEAPKGWGFGKAALKLSRSFQMSPLQVDGRPVAGASVTIPIRFTMS